MAYKIQWSEKQREAFVRRWVRFRSKYGLTQRALAEASGIHYNTVCRIERGHYYPNNETVIRFEEVESKFAKGEDVELALRKPGWRMEPGGTLRSAEAEDGGHRAGSGDSGDPDDVSGNLGGDSGAESGEDG